MNICIVFSTKFPPEEGIGNYVYHMSRMFIEKGHQVTVITRGSLSGTQREIVDDIEVFKLPFIPIYPFHVHVHGIFVNKMFKLLEPSLEIVHIHTPLPPPIKTSLPIITTFHTPMKIDIRFFDPIGSFYWCSKLQWRISYLIEKELIKKSRMITAVSKLVAQELKEYGLDPKDVVVIGNGVNEKVFTPTKYKIGDDRYILYTGRLAHRKGLFDLIECGKYICKKYPDVSFILTGKGPLLGKLQEKVKELELNEKFIFTGYVDKNKLIQLYQNATIYILPSHYEGLPTVLLEAMSCGLPVVATAVSGNLEVVSSGKNGILVPQKSPKEMADAISMLLDDDKMRKELGKNARETVEERYTWDIISDKILRCYEPLLETNR